ncbi:MAG: nucleotidyltransferase family protein [Planctomycetota bacterium]|jgi:hypothetical protein
MMDAGKKEGLEEKFISRALHDFIYQNSTRLPQPAKLDWNRMDALIFHYNLMPIFHFLYKSLPFDPERIQRWHRVRINFLRKNILVLKTAADLFSIFEQNGIAAVALRGLNLAHFYYPDPGLRPMRDVDILINPQDRHKLKSVLESRGYLANRVLRSQLVYTINQIIFEFHWSFLTARRYRTAIDSASLISSRIPKKTSEGLIFCLPREQELISVVAHAFIHHELDSLMPLIDLGLLMAEPNLDWDYIIAWCHKRRLTNLFLFTLSFANRLLMLNREEYLLRFNRSLPADIMDTFGAYAAAIWGRYTFRSRLLRMKTLFYVAERPFTKLRQFLRLIHPQEFRTFHRLLIKGKLLRRGGMELGLGNHATGKFQNISNL